MKTTVNLSMLIVLAGVAIGALLVLLMTSSGILVYQEKAGNGYFCRYFTGTGTFTTPSYAVTGCPRSISVNR
jgi:hypothetical protein